MIPRREPVVELPDPMVVEILKKMTPWRRLKLASGMWDSAVVISRMAIRTAHPDWSEAQLRRECAKRLSNGATENVPTKS